MGFNQGSWRKDADGHFYYGGRSDDIIISAGWTMSAIEIEDVLLKHEKVEEAAVIGCLMNGTYSESVSGMQYNQLEGLAKELQEFTKSRLSLHGTPAISNLWMQYRRHRRARSTAKFCATNVQPEANLIAMVRYNEYSAC